MGEFKKVISKSQVQPGSCQLVDVNGTAVALFNIENTFHAISNTCPHRGGPLSEGDINGKEVTCPFHGWTFDVTTGNATTTPASVQCYQVKVEGDDVLVEVQ